MFGRRLRQVDKPCSLHSLCAEHKAAHGDFGFSLQHVRSDSFSELSNCQSRTSVFAKRLKRALRREGVGVPENSSCCGDVLCMKRVGFQGWTSPLRALSSTSPTGTLPARVVGWNGMSNWILRMQTSLVYFLTSYLNVS
jgi:hypothetical protein